MTKNYANRLNPTTQEFSYGMDLKTHSNPIVQSTNRSIQQTKDLMYSNTQGTNKIIEGCFPQENTEKAMAIKKVNKTLCGMLLCLIFVSIISYYFVVSSEIKLNEYSHQTMMLNDENADLQNKLDRLKSFSNVDMTMQKTNLLQKPDKVIEAPEVQTNNTKAVQFETERPFSWSIGY